MPITYTTTKKHLDLGLRVISETMKCDGYVKFDIPMWVLEVKINNL